MSSRFLAVVALALSATAGSAAEPPKPETQIACAVRVLTVRDDLFERAGIDAKLTALTDAQLRALMDTVQGDPRSNVMQFPKATLLHSQEAVIRATQQQLFVTAMEATRVKGQVVLVPKNTPVETGTTLTLGVKASADRKTTTVRVNYKDVWVEGPVELIPVTTQINPVFADGGRGKPIPFTQYIQSPQVETLTIEKADLSIPSGGHVIIPGATRTQEVRQEFGPPVLSKIPYLNRMFKNVGVGRETVRTYLIVSPLVLDLPADPAPKR